MENPNYCALTGADLITMPVTDVGGESVRVVNEGENSEAENC